MEKTTGGGNRQMERAGGKGRRPFTPLKGREALKNPFWGYHTKFSADIEFFVEKGLILFLGWSAKIHGGCFRTLLFMGCA